MIVIDRASITIIILVCEREECQLDIFIKLLGEIYSINSWNILKKWCFFFSLLISFADVLPSTESRPRFFPVCDCCIFGILLCVGYCHAFKDTLTCHGKFSSLYTWQHLNYIPCVRSDRVGDFLFVPQVHVIHLLFALILYTTAGPEVWGWNEDEWERITKMKDECRTDGCLAINQCHWDEQWYQFPCLCSWIIRQVIDLVATPIEGISISNLYRCQ